MGGGGEGTDTSTPTVEVTTQYQLEFPRFGGPVLFQQLYNYTNYPCRVPPYREVNTHGVTNPWRNRRPTSLFCQPSRNISNKTETRAQRTLTLITNSLQGLATMTTFGVKEPWIEPMNKFLIVNCQYYQTYSIYLINLLG